MSHKVVDINQDNKVEYCIPMWLKDEQIKLSVNRFSKRIEPGKSVSDEPVALVCFGPSLNQTWKQLEGFKKVMTCSGGHKFVRQYGIVPTWHVELDPRAHKIELIGNDIHKDTQFMIASCCHPKLFDHLEQHGANITLWHTSSGESDDMLPLVYPRGDWILTGGANVGLRALVMLRFLGYTNIHIFGMDGSFPAEEGGLKHATFHPNTQKGYILTEYEGKQYATTLAFLECAKWTFHELEMLPDVNFTFYGDGLIQAMAKNKLIKRQDKVGIAYYANSTISPLYRELNAELHRKNPTYGTVAMHRHLDNVLKVYNALECRSILDYGCGKGMLAKQLDFPIWEYDPAIPGKDTPPRPADMVVVIDVLEHIEPQYLHRVLEDIYRCTKKVVFFAIGTEPAMKTLPDGRNTHLIVHNKEWWVNTLSKYFIVPDKVFNTPKCNEFYTAAVPRPGAEREKKTGMILEEKECLCVVR